MIIQGWVKVTNIVLQSLWQGLFNSIPNLIVAFAVFFLGWLISRGYGKLVTEILVRLKLNELLEKSGWKKVLEKAELKINAAEFLGGIVKWGLVIIFLLVAVEILGLSQFADFLKSVLFYLPNVIVASLIFVVTVILVDILEKVARTAVERVKMGYGQIVGVVVRRSVWGFAILAILDQLGIARPFIQTLFTGFVAMLVISFGLAFGLGGKDLAAEILRELEKKLRE